MDARRKTRSTRRPFGRRGDEWTIYALAVPPLPSAIEICDRTVRGLGIGPIGVLGVTPAEATTYTEAALRDQHDVVLALAAKFDPLLPVRFGSRMTRFDLQNTIRRSADILSTALDNVRGRRQMTLRLMGPPSTATSAAQRSGAAYLQQRRAAYSIPSELDPVRAAVRRFVAEERIAPGRAGVRITLFHLVEENCVGRYEEAIERTSKALPPGSVTVTGPWPPFAFAPELPS
jgi:hypothetical protein